jgi:hypothetical protein
MAGWDDGAAVQRKAKLRLLSALPILRLQDSAERIDASGVEHYPVPEVRRRIRRDGGPQTHQHILRAEFPTPAYTGSHAKQAGIAQASREFHRDDGLSSRVQTA